MIAVGDPAFAGSPDAGGRMRSHSIPPDRDPDLRHAFALDADDQVALIDRMVGDTPAGLPMCWAFEPAAAVRRTRKGFPVWLGQSDLSVTPPNAHEPKLSIRIIHSDLLRPQRPRSPAAVARFESILAQAGPRIGTVTL